MLTFLQDTLADGAEEVRLEGDLQVLVKGRVISHTVEGQIGFTEEHEETTETDMVVKEEVFEEGLGEGVKGVEKVQTFF